MRFANVVTALAYAPAGVRMNRQQATHPPLPPDDDPFFAAPSGFESLAPGTLLRSRRVNIALFGLVPQRISAWNLLYRTCNRDGGPAIGTTTALLPKGVRAHPNRPLVSYQCAIDAVSARCFPSYALQQRSDALGSLAQFELVMIGHLLDRGWAVTVPDHEGCEGHWGAGREPGYHILDGIRAAMAFKPLRLTAGASIGMWGYSGGGLATSWAAELAVEYAPELDIVGVALGSPVADPAGAFDNLNGTRLGGLPTLFLAGLQRAYPAVDRVLQQYVTREGLDLLDAVGRMTTVSALARLAGLDLGHYTTRPIAEILVLPQLRSVFDDIRVGSRVPAAPLFVVQAVHDRVIDAKLVDRQIRHYISGGAHVTYRRDRLSDHIALHVLSTPTVVAWLADRFAQLPLPAADTRTIWSIACSTTAVRGLFALARTVIKVVTGSRIGDRPSKIATTMASECDKTPTVCRHDYRGQPTRRSDTIIASPHGGRFTGRTDPMGRSSVG